jgi:hypothetical protein
VVKWLDEINSDLEPYFKDKPIVLVDIGASGTPPDEWLDISHLSCYVGFDPDRRELREDNSYGFRRFIMVNKAITETNQQEVAFFLTRSPFCSSTLKPNMNALSSYSFTDRFVVEKTAIVPAISLDSALRDAALEYVDWVKLDTQGKDLDILRSLGDQQGKGVLVVEIEPEIMEFYHGEKTFPQAHSYLLENSYWLSNAVFQRFTRISQATRERLGSRVDYAFVSGNPTSVDAQYFRTLAHLGSNKASTRDYLCLWIFSMLNRHHGFALDIGAHLTDGAPEERIGELLTEHTLRAIERLSPRFRRFKKAAKSRLPHWLLPPARAVITLLRSVKPRKRR